MMVTQFSWEAKESMLRHTLSSCRFSPPRRIPPGGDAVSWLAAMEAGELTAEELLYSCFEKILCCDRTLNAIISLCPDAMDEARRCDQLRTQGDRRPLLGLPIVVKDNINVRGLPTTLGAAVLADSCPRQDAELVRLLRQAGAVVVGKASLSEYASSGMTYNSLIGQTRNPYDLTRTPGGSSGGSAVAVAMEYAAVGLGTDGVNSVRSPASATGLIGLRPTKGSLPLDGIAPSSQTQDMAGFLVRSARDAALLLDTLACPSRPFKPQEGSSNLHGRKVILLRNNCGQDTNVLSVVEQTILCLRNGGATVEERWDHTLDATRMLKEDNVIRYEQKENVDHWLSAPEGGYPVHSLQEYLNTGRVVPDVAQALRETLRVGSEPGLGPYQRRLKQIQLDRTHTLEQIQQDQIDAFCYPAQRIPVVPIGDPQGQAGRNGILASALGLPAVSFFAGFTPPTRTAPLGIPVGMELMGAPGSEQDLLAMVWALQQRIGASQPPELLQRIEI